jgi:hypothetical protein
MSIYRVSCLECGLAATHITSGDRAATSFSSEEATLRCKDFRQVEEQVLENVIRCGHLRAAIEEVTNALAHRAAFGEEPHAVKR